VGVDPSTGEPASREPRLDAPFSALVFKVVANPSADICWLRVYSGVLGTEERCYHPRSATRLRLRRMLRIRADRTEPVERAECGDIVAVPAVKDIVTGDTVCDPGSIISYEPIQFPETVVSVAVEAQTSADRERLLDVVARLAREDPTFTFHTDGDTGQLILAGMGELHLEVLRNRMQREFAVTARFGRPRVSYRETISTSASGLGEFDRKIGDVQVTARARVHVAPRPRAPGTRGLPPLDVTLDGTAAQLPPPLQAAVRAALTDASTAGGPHGYPVVDVTARVEHVEVGTAPDPQAAILAALTVAWRHALQNAGAVLLEPVMRLDVRVPPDGLGAVMRDLGARRAEVHETELAGPSNLVRAFAPLAELFGYSTDLRSLTQGRGSFSMEPYDYQPVSAEIAARQDAFL